ncbi:MAG TPA: hypothetical protein VMC80_03105, partial [Patescibacteria group bacterium]|nr:hypothetical protein [Patescibacteria group bacterium]
MKKGVVFIVLFMFFLTYFSLISASSVSDSIPIQIQTLDDSGNIINGTFQFTINISNSNTCTPVLYTNTTTLTTDPRGVVSYTLDNMNIDFISQYWFCYYRDGVLKQIIRAARVPYAFNAKNVTTEGIISNSNLNLGLFNVTTSGTLLSQQVCINGDCRTTWPASVGGSNSFDQS